MKSWLRDLFTPARRPVVRRERLGLLALEDRTTPTVTATKNGAGLLTINYSGLNDAATITAESTTGTSVRVTGTNFTQTDFTGVTAITVNDATIIGVTNQSLSVLDEFSVIGSRINLTGAFTVNGIENVNLAQTYNPLTAGDITIDSRIVSVGATSPGTVLPQLSSTNTIRITAAGTDSNGNAIGSLNAPLGINGGSKLLIANSTASNGNQNFDLGGGIRNVDGQTDRVDAGTGRVTLTNGELFGLGNDDFGDQTTFNLGQNAVITVFHSETIGWLTGTGSVGASASGVQTLVVGGGNASSQFDGSLQDVAGTPAAAGGLALATTGTGTFTLNGANTLTGGVTVNGGTLRLIGDQTQNRLPAKSTVTVNAGGTFEIANSNPTPQGVNAINLTLNGGAFQVAGATNGGTHLGNVTFNNGGTIKANGTVSSFGGFNVAVNGNVSLTGSGDATIDLPDGIGLGSAATFDIAAGRTLTLSQTTGVYDSNAGTAKSLVKAGAGTLAINGPVNLSNLTPANAGAVTASAGTLLLNGTVANGAADPDVVVTGTGTVGGAGNIMGTVQVQTGGTLSPGSATTAATLSTGSVTFQSGGFFAAKVNGPPPGNSTRSTLPGPSPWGTPSSRSPTPSPCRRRGRSRSSPTTGRTRSRARSSDFPRAASSPGRRARSSSVTGAATATT